MGTLLLALVCLARRFDKMMTSPSLREVQVMNKLYHIYLLLVTRKIILKNIYIAKSRFLVIFLLHD